MNAGRTNPDDIHVLSYALPRPWEDALDGWLAWLIAAGCSPATRHTRRANIRRVARELGCAHPCEVSGADLLVILGREGCSLEYRRARRASLASFYRWCLSTEIVDTDPTLALPVIRTPTPAPKPATDEIWEALLAAADCRVLLWRDSH